MQTENKYKGRIKAFTVAFLITILLSILLSFVLTSLYRMENVMSPKGYVVLNIQKNEEKIVNIVALNKNYNLNFSQTSKVVNYVKKFDVLIPSEIRAFFCGLKYGEEAVNNWVYSLIQ